LARLEKSDHPVSCSGLSDFGSFQNRNREFAKLKDLKIQDVLRHEKNTKRYQGAKMEEIQGESQSHKKQIVQFWIPKYPVFPEQIESE
jgi:hypothetical protein